VLTAGGLGNDAHVIDQLPGEIKELWPESARTFRARVGQR
jgi:hypothetical protein